jgi:NTE family protein
MAKTALVISGGGSKGAFAVGVLDYIHREVKPIDSFDMYCGTSTGSLIVPLAACGELELLKEIYTTIRQDEVIKKGGISNLLNAISLHDASPLKQLLDKTVTPAHFTHIRDNRIPVFLSTVCLQTEQLVYWATQPLAASRAYEVELIDSIELLRGAMLASSCQPVFLQPLQIRSRQYADGGVRETTPLQAAVDAGAETIFAITLSPEATPTNDGLLTSATQLLERTIDMFSEDVGQNDYRLARLYQQGNQYLQSVRDLLLSGGVAESLVDAALAQPGNPFSGTAVTVIHEIRPPSKLEEGGAGGLTFEPRLLEQMFEKGVREAEIFFNAIA